MKIKRFLGYTVASVGLLLAFSVAKPASAQISINIGGGGPPSCPYGYYDYAPYSCAPVGFYGPGYFYNGIFLGVGPWYQWGYGHGWGGHRFGGPGGGRYYGRYSGGYHGGGGYHGPVGHGGPPHGGGGRPGPSHGGGGRPPQGGGGPSHGGGGRPGGGSPSHGGGGGDHGGHH